jgi:hypothetical protein
MRMSNVEHGGQCVVIRFLSKKAKFPTIGTTGPK